MKARKEFDDYEAVLSYCCDKTLRGYEQALQCGLSRGYFTDDYKLTPMGRKVAQLLKDLA